PRLPVLVDRLPTPGHMLAEFPQGRRGAVQQGRHPRRRSTKDHERERTAHLRPAELISMPGAVLEGLKVLDLSWGIAGPMATMLLADHGAAVTRIEPPGGDPFRTQLGYRTWQRGKRSAVLDLKTPADRDCLLALAHGADILVESFAPGVTARLGIDYARLHEVNSRLIYCSITAYGRGNRHSERPGYD